jgi:hypothetical protein
MVHGAILILISIATGFGLGRVKNGKKLATVTAELAALKALATKVETSVASKL